MCFSMYIHMFCVYKCAQTVHRLCAFVWVCAHVLVHVPLYVCIYYLYIV